MPIEATGDDLVSGLCCLGFVMMAVIGLVFLFRRPKGAPRGAPAQHPHRDPNDPYAGLSTAELNQLASGQLIEADNALRTSEQELGFAVAQYGAEATQSFSQALNASREDVAHAFQLRQQLDDDVPEDDATQRRMLAEIMDRCRRADQRLDAEADAFNRLRAMESQAEQLAADLAAKRDTARAALPIAANTLNALAARYTGPLLQAVEGNVEQAAARVDFADDQLAQANMAITGGDRARAALCLRGAEQAIGQATVLLEGLAKAQKNLEEARAGLNNLLADAQGQIAAGRAALEASGGTGNADADRMSLAAAVAKAEQVVSDARTELAAPRTDPIGATQRVESVAQELNGSLGGIRDAASRAQQARTLLDQALFAARSSVDAATDFVTTRRGAIGSAARTRLMEAQRQLDQAVALAAGDPVAALSAAKRANDFAERAIAEARSDVSAWPGGGGGTVVIGAPGGAILGGILIDSMFGGGMRGGGGMRSRRWGFAPETPAAREAPQSVPGRYGGPTTSSRQ